MIKDKRLRERGGYYVTKLSDAAALESFKAHCSTAEKFKTVKPVSVFGRGIFIFRKNGNSFLNNPRTKLSSLLAAT